MANILIVAPHADDETLGVGGTLLKHRAAGDQCTWLLTTTIIEHPDYPDAVQQQRAREIVHVSKQYGFAKVVVLPFLATRLDTYPLADVARQIGEVVASAQPAVVYCPHRGDAHSDHRITFEAVMACTKTFRAPTVRSVLMYETPSETDFAPALPETAFLPNVFVDISAYLEKKLEILQVYTSELAAHPFPRSLTGVQALATLRGAAAQVAHAEGFMLLKDIR